MSLTDERIVEIAKATRTAEWGWQGGYILPIDFARAIERESALKWTDALPTVPGWYWWRVSRNLNSPILMNVQQDIYSQFRIGGGAGTTVNSQGGQWAGPIPEPEE